MSDTINAQIEMTNDTTIFTVPVNLEKMTVYATSGTVTLQERRNGVWYNCDVTVANGTFKVAFHISQGCEFRVTGGNAIIHYWA